MEYTAYFLEPPSVHPSFSLIIAGPKDRWKEAPSSVDGGIKRPMIAAEGTTMVLPSGGVSSRAPAGGVAKVVGGLEGNGVGEDDGMGIDVGMDG